MSSAITNFARRWWQYQRERFPLFGHGPLVLAFSASAVCYSALLRAGAGSEVLLPAPFAFATAFIVCLLMFLQLRIADEFKDYEEDLRHRPYRPVPRGLVTLRGLRWLFVAGAILQGVVTGLLSARLLGLLALAWAYLALMSREFFVGTWLRKHPILYMVSHMCIMPLVDLFATGCDWAASPQGRPGSITGLTMFLSASYFNGMVIEVGRKVRSPLDEETGVNTYSRLYGLGPAVAGWWALIAVTAGFGAGAAVYAGSLRVFAPGAAAALLFAGLVALWVARKPLRGRGRVVETVSGLWTVVFYLLLGVVPAVLRLWN